MADLATLKARIADELGTDEFPDQVALAITDAIRHYRAYSFWFNSAITTVAATAGTASYSLPALWLEPGTVTLTDTAAQEWPIDPIDFNTYKEGTVGTAPRGMPLSYALLGQALYLYPTPDAAYTITFYSGTGLLADLANDAASNAWTTEAEALIRQRVKQQVTRNVLKDFDEADRIEVEELKELRNLQRETAQRSPVRTARPTWF